MDGPRMTPTMPMNTTSSNTSNKSALMDSLLGIVREALKHNHTEIIERYRNELIERILSLTSSIIETTSVALTNGEIPAVNSAVKGRHRDPTTTESIGNNNNNNFGSPDKLSDTLPQSKQRERTYTMPCVISPPLPLLPSQEIKQKGMSATSAITINISPHRSTTNPVYSSSKYTPHSDGPLRENKNTSDQPARRWPADGVMCTTGMRVDSPLFVQEREFTEEEMDAVLALISQYSHNKENKNRESVHSPYYELLHVRSHELSNTCMTVSKGNSSPSGGNGKSEKVIRVDHFIKSIYTYQQMEMDDGAAANASSTTMLLQKPKEETSGQRSKRPSVSPVFLPSADRRRNGLLGSQSARVKSALKTGPGVRRTSSKPSERIEDKDKDDDDLGSGSLIIWQPETTCMINLDIQGEKKLHTLVGKNTCGGMPNKNIMSCHGKKKKPENNEEDAEYKFDENYDEFIKKHATHELVMRSEKHIYTLCFSSPFSVQRKASHKKCDMYQNATSPITLRVVAPSASC